MSAAAATIERFDVTVDGSVGPGGPRRLLTFQARAAGPADGRAVILLHGVPQTSACWTAQLTALGDAGYRAVAFTQRGYSPGARIDDVAAFTLDKLAGDVLGVAEALGIEAFDVVGHDAGAGVAWMLAAFHTHRVRTVTIGSVPHPAAFGAAYRTRDEDGDNQHARSGYMREIVGRPRGEMEQMFLANDRQVMRAVFHGLPEESVAEYLDIVGTPEGMRGCLDWYRAGVVAREQGIAGGLDPNFPPIEIPTLYIWSDQDPAIGPSGAYATEDHVTGPYRFVVFEGVDHWIQEREPDRFSRELLDHLNAHP